MKQLRALLTARVLSSAFATLTVLILGLATFRHEQNRPRLRTPSASESHLQVLNLISECQTRVALAAVTDHLSDFPTPTRPDLRTVLIAKHARTGWLDRKLVAEFYVRTLAHMRRLEPLEPAFTELEAMGMTDLLTSGRDDVDADADGRMDRLAARTHPEDPLPTALLRSTPEGKQVHLFGDFRESAPPRYSTLRAGTPPVFVFTERIPVARAEQMQLRAFQWQNGKLRELLHLANVPANLYSFQDHDGDGSRELCLFNQSPAGSITPRAVYWLNGRNLEPVQPPPAALRPSGDDVWRPPYPHPVQELQPDPQTQGFLRKLDTIALQIQSRQFAPAARHLRDLTPAILAAPLLDEPRNQLLSECHFYQAVCARKLGRPSRAATLLASIYRLQGPDSHWSQLVSTRLDPIPEPPLN